MIETDNRELRDSHSRSLALREKAEMPAPMFPLTFRRNGVKHEHPELDERAEPAQRQGPAVRALVAFASALSSKL